MSVIKKCLQCIQKKTLTTKPQKTPIVAFAPRDRYIADLVDLKAYKTLNNGTSNLLVVVDCFTKFACVRILPSKEAVHVSEAFKEIFYTYGPPILYILIMEQSLKMLIWKEFVLNLEQGKYMEDHEPLGCKARSKD